jgi:putative ABC transport system substrate-binding protein
VHVNKFVFNILIVILSMTLLMTSHSTAWGASRVAVLYPEVREPYLSVFTSIISGIESRSHSRILPYALPEGFDPVSVEKWLSSHEADAVITLGSRGFLMADTLKNRMPVIVGAVLLTPNGLPGISMAADPAALFRNLQILSPRTRRIFVVYNPTESDWLVRHAREAARHNRLELEAYPVTDLREAVTAYRDLIDNQLGQTDAVWLPMDDVGGNDKVVLPMLLEAAWNRKFILFSSKPSHAKQGALFSQFPDNYGLGQSLAEMVNQMFRGQAPVSLVPAKDLQTAVNLRTAAHLGLSFSSEQQNSFQLKFP